MLYQRDGLEIEINEPEMYDSAVNKAIRGCPGPLDVVVDIGSHVGSLALYSARNKGTRRAWAFEPIHFDALVANVYRNQLQNIIVPMPFGVDWTAGDKLLQRITKEGTFSLLGGSAPYAEMALRPTVPFRSMFPSGWDEKVIDYMKIDIEGGEYRLFGGDDSLAVLRRVKFLDLEIHVVDRGEYALEELGPAFCKVEPAELPRAMFAWLREAGFKDFRWSDKGSVTWSKNYNLGD